MYTNDKKQRITLRLNDDMFEFIKNNSEMIGVSPSEFIRMILTSVMTTSKKIKDLSIDYMKGEVQGRENDESNINNKLQ